MLRRTTVVPVCSLARLCRAIQISACPHHSGARATRVMSDFFSPLEEDDVRRTRQDEDEERLAKEALDAVGDRARVFALRVFGVFGLWTLASLRRAGDLVAILRARRRRRHAPAPLLSQHARRREQAPGCGFDEARLA